MEKAKIESLKLTEYVHVETKETWNKTCVFTGEAIICTIRIQQQAKPSVKTREEDNM